MSGLCLCLIVQLKKIQHSSICPTADAAAIFQRTQRSLQHSIHCITTGMSLRSGQKKHMIQESITSDFAAVLHPPCFVLSQKQSDWRRSIPNIHRTCISISCLERTKHCRNISLNTERRHKKSERQDTGVLPLAFLFLISWMPAIAQLKI